MRIIIFLAAAVFAIDSFGKTFPAAEGDAIFDYLKAEYDSNELRVLIVPGHDDESSAGASFRGVREADLNVKVANEIFGLLHSDPHFKTFATRNENGYTPEFSGYFANNHADIISFREESKRVMRDLLSGGTIEENTLIHHNYASDDDSVKLYGINKWANENGIHLVLHVHFNDHPDRRPNRAGTYSGFSVYIPEKQLPNYYVSAGLAGSIFDQLGRYFPVSDHPIERAGIIEDQKLIAVGSNASLRSAAVLIEYGYIYESQLTNSRTQFSAVKELAHQTYLGIKKYFEPENNAKRTAIFPYEWKNYLEKGLKNNRDVFALQIALAEEGLYPPSDRTRNECGVTGNFGSCTEEATIAFQKKHGLPQSGFVGSLTLARLNELYFYEPPKSIEHFSYVWEKDLYHGIANDDDVRALQNALFLEGVYRGPMSGNFFDATREAVKKLQKKYDFNSALRTGYVGPLTRKILNDKFSSPE